MTRQKESLSQRLLKGSLIVLLIPILLPFLLIAYTLHLVHRTALYILVWLLWLPRGKDTLVVSSDSPIWRDYMETQIVPFLLERAFVLNWSERKTWPRWSLCVQLFRHFGGDSEFNPIVIIFRPFRRAKAFRFWQPFKDLKHGNRKPVERLRQEILSTH
jgi:hypothetical protein